MLYKHVLLSAFIPVYMQYILYVQFDWGWCCLCLSSCLDIVEGVLRRQPHRRQA